MCARAKHLLSEQRAFNLSPHASINIETRADGKARKETRQIDTAHLAAPRSGVSACNLACVTAAASPAATAGTKLGLRKTYVLRPWTPAPRAGGPRTRARKGPPCAARPGSEARARRGWPLQTKKKKKQVLCSVRKNKKFSKSWQPHFSLVHVHRPWPMKTLTFHAEAGRSCLPASAEPWPRLLKMMPKRQAQGRSRQRGSASPMRPHPRPVPRPSVLEAKTVLPPSHKR